MELHRHRVGHCAGRRRVAVGLLLAALMAVGVEADDLADLRDDFSADTRSDWSRRHIDENTGTDQLERWAINPPDARGRMIMMPHTSTWYQPYRGAIAYKLIEGDFAFTTDVTVSNRSGDGVPGSSFSLAGLMLRKPPQPADAAENYVFLSIGGHGGQARFEVKTTVNGNSTLQLTPSQTLTTQLQIARVGSRIVALYKRPDDADWTVHRIYDRPDLGGAIQAGFVAYTDWGKASTFAPAFQNVNALTPAVNGESSNPSLPFRPDLIAAFDYAWFARPEVPAGFDPSTAADADYLQFLGAHTAPEPGSSSLLLVATCGLVRRRGRSARPAAASGVVTPPR